MNKKIRIKDIAIRAGVSVGTVDRVLHNRPNVSESAMKKVQAALHDMDYQPNVYASALAYNRSFSIICLMPQHESEAYWDEVEDGLMRAISFRRDFHFELKMIYYNRMDDVSFADACNDCMLQTPNGVILVPTSKDNSLQFANDLHEQNIPLILLDSYIEELNPLAFFGQDSFHSGYFAAKMLMLIASTETDLMIMKRVKRGVSFTKQQENREVGFKHYMKKHFPKVKIHELVLPLGADTKTCNKVMAQFFETHKQIHHGITFNSKAWIVGEYLLQNHLTDIKIMGYDIVQRNAACMREGSISFLIAQHGYMQGYLAVDSMFRSIVLNQEVRCINYMPIELLSKENIDFYQRSTI